MSETNLTPDPAIPHKRRPRYSGKYPRRFEEKYKELNPERYAETVEQVLASGKTPAGTHRPIMVDEVLEILAPQPGEVFVDCTLGYGGHASKILSKLQPGGRLLGLDLDPVELPKTVDRMRGLGFGEDSFSAHRSNYAGLPQVLASAGLKGVDGILADLGVSSMQLDDPSRGFSTKAEGPLDLRMNPGRGLPASALLNKMSAENLDRILVENADEPNAARLASALAGRLFPTTTSLTTAIRQALPHLSGEEFSITSRRVFQALRILVNDEFSALETLLRHLPGCLNPGGRVVILTFHSGEDRRVKKAFEAALKAGLYDDISYEVMRPSPEERHDNPRSSPAKLRWAKKA